jgi:hypothetical protein
MPSEDDIQRVREIGNRLIDAKARDAVLRMVGDVEAMLRRRGLNHVPRNWAS